jgi:two-component system sensor histidine kinase/response regulator
MLQRADAQDPYQLVLMDWHMPGQDGVETTRQIMQTPGLQHLPAVVMVTAFGTEELRTLGAQAGARAFIDKPVSQSRLWDVLAEVLHQASPRTQPLVQPAGNEPVWDLTGLKVLLVEDNPINQQIAVELMEAKGVQVTVAQDGQEALDILHGAPDPVPWALVLMDLQMPRVCGHTATIELRKNRRFDDLPILAMTAHAFAEEGERCFAEGMNAHLTKPIDPQILYRCLVRWRKGIAAAASVQPERRAQEVSEVADPQLEIEGIDTALGMRQCAGNATLYASLLRQFREQLQHSPQQLHAALQQDDYEQAKRIVHSLKGVSANLGAKGLQELCTTFEAQCKNPGSRTVLVNQYEDFVRQAAALVQALAVMVVETESPPISVPTSSDDIEHNQQHIRQLVQLLEDSNTEAYNYMQDHAEALRRILGDNCKIVMSHVQNFDFDQALNTLKHSAS